MNLNILKVGFNLKLISREELLNWSDTNLIEDNNEDFFLELSSISSKDSDESILLVLDKYYENFIIEDFERFHSIILSFFLMSTSDWGVIQKKMINYFNLISDNLSDRDFGFWSALKDDLQLRKEGLPGCLRVPKDLKRYFDYFEINVYRESFFNTVLRDFDTPR